MEKNRSGSATQIRERDSPWSLSSRDREPAPGGITGEHDWNGSASAERSESAER